MSSKPVQELEAVVIRFAGDSGDGMQITGDRFTSEAAHFGNDLRTLPDFPAEIRAPAGTLAGVSSFQLRFAHQPVFTPGDAVDVLIVMNPAALKANLAGVRKGGIIIANIDQFGDKNLRKAGYATNPLNDGTLESFQVYPVDIAKLTKGAVEGGLALNTGAIDRCKNFFALGLCLWMYSRALQHTLTWIDAKFAKTPDVAEANRRALKAGYYYGETAEAFPVRYSVKSAELPPGLYRNISGNKALAYGLIVASKKAGVDLFLGSYPITPASDILHELTRHKAFGVHTIQAEDELAAVTAAIGASFGGALAVTTTSGPGVALKSEAIGLAGMVELPLVVVDVQRGGPSTGLPTKTEQADLFQALYGRNSESPVPVLAAAAPADCFEAAFEASRIALKYMTPVMLLSDGYVANGSEPWLVPDMSTVPTIELKYETESFKPYDRDPETLARPRVLVGTKGLEHRIGGLEKEHLTGAISYDPKNHERMVRLRAAKVAGIVREIGPTEVTGGDSGEVLLLGWGGTRGAIHGAGIRLRAAGKKVSTTHLRWLNPLPSDLADIFAKFEMVIVPELNLGQLAFVLRAKTLVDVKSICKVQGQPFREQELVDKVHAYLDDRNTSPFGIDGMDDVAGDIIGNGNRATHATLAERAS
ncbi:MAG: 2-oxoacid:acceptor oxidoreductase subunit alpha [Clostridia bacterium]|nr:2-oxoacid:acceptor oxidoreductase subunit alpha [Deltaproteobacteria bacterium]